MSFLHYYIIKKQSYYEIYYFQVIDVTIDNNKIKNDKKNHNTTIYK